MTAHLEGARRISLQADLRDDSSISGVTPGAQIHTPFFGIANSSRPSSDWVRRCMGLIGLEEVEEEETGLPGADCGLAGGKSATFFGAAAPKPAAILSAPIAFSE